MPYQWKSEKIVLVTLPEKKFGMEGPAQQTKDTQILGFTLHTVKNAQRLSIPISWEQKYICRYCSGTGCERCNHLGYFAKTRNEQMQTPVTTQNGAWTRFVGWGDERPDMCGFGDIIMVCHLEGTPKPDSLDPALGNLYDSSKNAGDLDGIFASFFGGSGSGAAPVWAKFCITRKEAADGCGKNISVSVREVCPVCRGSGQESAPTLGMCKQCHGAGLLQKEKKLLLQIPPETKNNTTITLQRVGNSQMVDGTLQTGDVFVKIKVKLLPF